MNPHKPVNVFLQYYKPHVSGLTNMAAVLAEYAVEQGFEVHVHCVSSTRRTTHSVVNGVQVHAYARTLQIRRAAFSLRLLWAMARVGRTSGLVHAHLPYPESFLLARLVSSRSRIIATYQCDAPQGSRAENLVASLLDWSHRILIRRSSFVIASSRDYAANSRLSTMLLSDRGRAIPATSIDRAGGVPRFKVPGKILIGFIGRPTYEKGINVLLEALDSLPSHYCVLFAGPIDGLTEDVGYDRDLFEKFIASGRIISLGYLEDEDIPDFYASLDVYVHPSVNSFDAFGIVQVEAVSAGVPVVASDLPGIRTIVGDTGLGVITKAGDAKSLRDGLVDATSRTFDATAARQVLESNYLYPKPHDAYLEIYEGLLATLD